jgi:hypothetical protein
MYRQAVVNIDRALRDGELIPKRHRHVIEAMLQHGDERVRAYAANIIERDARVRRELAECYREDESGITEIELSWVSDDIPF